MPAGSGSSVRATGRSGALGAATRAGAADFGGGSGLGLAVTAAALVAVRPAPPPFLPVAVLSSTRRDGDWTARGVDSTARGVDSSARDDDSSTGAGGALRIGGDGGVGRASVTGSSGVVRGIALGDEARSGTATVTGWAGGEAVGRGSTARTGRDRSPPSLRRRYV